MKVTCAFIISIFASASFLMPVVLAAPVAQQEKALDKRFFFLHWKGFMKEAETPQDTKETSKRSEDKTLGKRRGPVSWWGSPNEAQDMKETSKRSEDKTLRKRFGPASWVGSPNEAQDMKETPKRSEDKTLE